MRPLHHLFVGRLATILALLALASCTTVSVPKPQKGQASVPPALALQRLKEGNARFVKGDLARKPSPILQRANLAEGQAPFAVIVACADSRTAPELVFDKPLGGLFVVRCAGNLVDRYGMGSIEYAVEHLGARLVVVLGHQNCGAVAAAMDGGHAPGHIGDLLEKIAPAVQATKGRSGDALQNAINENARRVAAQVRGSRPDLKSLAHGEEVTVLSACYDLNTGAVSWSD
jgi:carbonic anhydrase